MMVALSGLLSSVNAQLLIGTDNLPPKYEMRGVWVSTVVNLDWPSKKGLSVEQQKLNLFI